MLTRQIKAYWAAITGVVGVVGAVGTLWLTNQDQRSRLNDSERDFVLKVIELQNTTDPAKADANAKMTALVAKYYLRNQKFLDEFLNNVAAQSVATAGSASVSDQTAKAADGGSPQVGAAARSVGEVAAAASLAPTLSAAGVAPTASVTSLLQAPVSRVFFQYVDPDQLQTSKAVRAQLAGVLGARWNIQGDERVPNYKSGTQVRYFFPADRDGADRLAATLRTAFPKLTCQRIGGYQTNAAIRPGLFEVWLGAGDTPASPVSSAPPARICS